MSNRDRNTGGFTLIELLVIMVIIGILAALLFPVLDRTKAEAKRTACTGVIGLDLDISISRTNRLLSNQISEQAIPQTDAARECRKPGFGNYQPQAIAS